MKRASNGAEGRGQWHPWSSSRAVSSDLRFRARSTPRRPRAACTPRGPTSTTASGRPETTFDLHRLTGLYLPCALLPYRNPRVWRRSAEIPPWPLGENPGQGVPAVSRQPGGGRLPHPDWSTGFKHRKGEGALSRLDDG